MKRMKLWQQIFLCSLAMIMLAIDIIACLLLYRSHQLLVEQEQSRGVSDHQSFSVNLVNNVLYERLKQNRFFLAEETVLELIKKQTDTQGEPGSGVLVAKDKRWLASRNPCLLYTSLRRRQQAFASNTKGSPDRHTDC